MTPSLLIVDDNPANLRLYEAMLQDLGADVHTARNGEEALARYRERPYAMVLLDVQLSGMSGFDVAQAMRDSQPEVEAPIVFASAMYVHERDTHRGYRLGAVDYILSPVMPEVLRAKAAVFIRLSRMRAEVQDQARAVEAAYRELRAVHAEMEGFSYSVSHDLRTPLGQVMGFADLLRLGHAGELTGKAREYVGYIEAAARRMNVLIDDMLLLAQMTRAEMQVQRVDLSGMVEELLEELSAAHPNRRLDCSVQPGVEAMADTRLLRVALSNLLSNAWKYGAGTAQLRIEFGQSQRDGQPVFHVRDNGAGFDARGAGERLFRPFQRFHAETAFQGNGVGLAIVQRVIAKHNGSIWAASAPGEGACFFFTLCAAPQAPPRNP